MLTIFESILLGHLVGDYVFQNSWMAQRKGSFLLPCVVHCLIYTLCLCVSVSKGFNFYWALVVFVSHFPVDRYSLADKWLKLIEGRTLAGFLNYGHKNIPASIKGNHIGNYRILRGGFTSLVYCIVDNTFHLLLMLSGYKLLVKLGLM